MPDLDALAVEVADHAATRLFGEDVISEGMVKALAAAIIHASPYLKLATAEQLTEIYEVLVDALHARNAQHLGGVN